VTSTAYRRDWSAVHHHPALVVLSALNLIALGVISTVAAPAMRNGVQDLGISNQFVLDLLSAVSWKMNFFSLALGCLLGFLATRNAFMQVDEMARPLIDENRIWHQQLSRAVTAPRARALLAGWTIVLAVCVTVPCFVATPLIFYSAAFMLSETPLHIRVCRIRTQQNRYHALGLGLLIVSLIACLFFFLFVALLMSGALIQATP
jgi:hypothetical protein